MAANWTGPLRSDDSLQSTVSTHVAAVDRRIGASGRYRHEGAEIRAAVEALPVVHAALGLGSFVRSLTPPTGKPQLLLVFEPPTHGDPVLLKLYGRQRPGEGAVQAYWTKVGVRCAPTIAHGNDPTSWLLMELVPGKALSLDGDVGAVTTELASLVRAAHESTPLELSGTQTLAAGVMGHLEVAVATLTDRGHDAPGGWRGWAADAYRDGEPTVLHGDLFPGNVLRDDRDGVLRVLDSCAYVGDRAFDAARWTVRVSQPTKFDSVIRSWRGGEPALDDRVVAGMLAAESLMQAGVIEIIKAEAGLPVDRGSSTMSYLRAIPPLLDRWQRSR